MGTRTWELKINGQIVRVKAQKALAERCGSEIRKVLSVQHSWKEINGVVGGESREGILMSLFGPGDGKIADLEGYEADKVAFFASLPDPITPENMTTVINDARALYAKHLPVVDKRQTAKEIAERDESIRQAEADREAARLAWIDQHCRDQEVVARPEGQMAVTLTMTYDDSDIMTDYFSAHHSWGERMLIGFAPKGAQREALARAAIARYPELSALSWTWHTENYSMGHGNYLISEYTGQDAEGVITYGGRENPGLVYEVQFDDYGKTHYAYKNYPGKVSELPKSTEAKTADGVTIEQDRDWLWVTFPTKPADDILTKLRELGGRFSGRRKAWYFTDASREQTIRAVLA